MLIQIDRLVDELQNEMSAAIEKVKVDLYEELFKHEAAFGSLLDRFTDTVKSYQDFVSQAFKEYS